MEEFTRISMRGALFLVPVHSQKGYWFWRFLEEYVIRGLILREGYVTPAGAEGYFVGSA